MHSSPRLKIFGSVLLIGLVFMANLFAYREKIASFVWQKTHLELVQYIDPWNSELAFSIGNYYYNHGTYDIKKAKKYLERAAGLNPTDGIAHYQLGRILFIEGRFIEALKHIKRVQEIDPDFHQAYYMQGLILGYQGHLLEAVIAFEEYVRRVPTTWAGYNDLAWLYFQLGDYEKVLSVSAQGLKNSPQNAWLLNMHGLALHNLGQSEEARDYFDRAKEKVDHMNPEDWGKAYPGNDPAIYAEGLERMREAITHNLALIPPTTDSTNE